MKKKTPRKLTPIEVARLGAKASPWRNQPGCPTKRAAAIFKHNQRTPHPDTKK